MNKNWLFIIVIVTLLSFIVGGQIFIFTNKKKLSTEKKDSVLPPPTELTTEFDPTINPSIFSIFDSDLEDNTLNLEYLWPTMLADKKRKVVSKITCVNNDIKLITKSDSNTINVTLQTLFQKIIAIPKKDMIFSGICKDLKCNEINKDCQLYIDSI